MARHCLAVVVPLLLSMVVEAIYHELSMATFSAPSDVMNGSLFGYSIAYQPKSRKLVTSAPNFGTGNIYECNIDSKKCEKIEVNGTQEYKYSNMWLGATVATGHNFTVACAPRYTETTYGILGTFGRCYATSPGELKMIQMPTVNLPEIVKPLEKNMDSFGWSINVDRHDTITVGGPAMSKGRAISYNEIHANPELITAQLGFQPVPNFNFGYGVTSGNFLSAIESDIVYAISSPYGKIGYGMVIISDLSNWYYLSNPKSYRPGVGSLFGGALASASLRGPGQRQALLIGAPTYAPKGRVDVGSLYIYQFDPAKLRVVHQKTILGKQDNGQFGTAIISLGDLNGDKKDEIAVAAPYEDSGWGAVYIYSGGHLLSDVADSRLQALQRIQPEGFKAFGLSLAALRDYDDNGCNELAIGAPYSDKFALFRCMAKIKVMVQRLEEQKRQNDTYFTFKSCMKIVFPEKPKIIKADIQLRVSISHKDANLVGAIKDMKSVEHKIEIRNKISPMCVDVGIIIPKVVGYEPSIQYQITATQLNSPIYEKNFDGNHVLLSDLSVLNVSDTVWVADCAGKGECKPRFNLTMDATIPENYTIGSSDTENISFSAWNSGDVAYKPRARVDLRGVQVVKLPSTCTLSEDTLDCFPKQPVEKNTLWKSVQIELDMKSLKSNVKSITVAIFIYPNNQPKAIPIKTERTFNLQPDYKGIVLKGATMDKIDLTQDELIESGKHTTHIYTVYNNGMTLWYKLICLITTDPKYYHEDFLPSVDSESTFQCEVILGKDGRNVTMCTITELRKFQKFQIIIPIYIKPGKVHIDELDDDINNKITVTSHLKLIYEDKQKMESIVSRVTLKEAAVPIWIVIIAALVGLLIIIIIVFALYECGFLRRKNKDKLKRLRRSVHRQSVRRSMRVSTRATSASERLSSDRKQLINQNRNSNGNTNAAMANDAEDTKTTTEIKGERKIPQEGICVLPPKATYDEKMEKEERLEQTDVIIPKGQKAIPTNKVDPTNSDLPKTESNVRNTTEIPKKVADKSKIINNDHIIRGLQKNVVQNTSLTKLPATAKEAADTSSE